MKDWELLRDELAAIEEKNIKVDDVWQEVFENDIKRSDLRNIDNEDEFADNVERNLFWLINHNILTDEITTKYKGFFDRHGLPIDIKKFYNEKVGELAVKKYKE